MNLPPADYRTPGQLIQALLEAHGWTSRALAIILDVDETVVNKLLSGRRRVDARMSLLLGEVFGVPPVDFLELQKLYDLARAKIEARPDPTLTTRARLFGDLPITEMIKRGWLDADDIRNVEKVENALIAFFGATSLEEIEILPHAAKKTSVSAEVTPAQISWIYRVRAIASEMLVGRYSSAAVEAAIAQLKPLLIAPEASRKVPRILAEAGIRFVIVESLPTAKIDGVCFWLSDTKPIIGMSLRYDRVDNFWFVLRHELEHVLRGHGREQIALDAELEGEKAGTGIGVPDEERIANEAAADFCVPRAQMERFIARKAPFFAERDILGFAATLHVHPGLVAGQIQNVTGRYDRFRTHLTKIRSFVAPSAIVDGWGDVAPVGA